MRTLLVSITILIIQYVNLTGQSILLDKDSIELSTYKINSISPEDLDFSDLEFLKTELKDVEIVMLGEQSHGDGSTFLAKSRLIKFLHQEMNFDVLVFESGLYDCDQVWKNIELGADSVSVFDGCVFGLWSKSKQVEPVLSYVLEQAQEKNPLQFAGFDIQPTSSTMKGVERYNLLTNYLNSLPEFDSTNYVSFLNVMKNLGANFGKRPNDDFKNSFKTEAAELKRFLKSLDTQKSLLHAQYVGNIEQILRLVWNADMTNPNNSPNVFNIRDRGMAQNLSFLKETVFSGRKIIVWGANSHLGYGRSSLEGYEGLEVSAKSMVPMGQYMKMDYGDVVYTISFSSFDGNYGTVFWPEGKPVPPAKDASLENKLSEMGYLNAFLSLKNSEYLKGKVFPARLYGYADWLGQWNAMTDGIFFTKTMKPSEKRNE